jgi:hypothetical protein
MTEYKLVVVGGMLCFRSGKCVLMLAKCSDVREPYILTYSIENFAL